MIYFTIVCIVFAILAAITLGFTQVNIHDNEAELSVLSIIACMLFVAMFFWSVHTGCSVATPLKPKSNLPAEVQTKE